MISKRYSIGWKSLIRSFSTVSEFEPGVFEHHPTALFAIGRYRLPPSRLKQTGRKRIAIAAHARLLHLPHQIPPNSLSLVVGVNVQIPQFGRGGYAKSSDAAFHLDKQRIIDELRPLGFSRQPNLQLRVVITRARRYGRTATNFYLFNVLNGGFSGCANGTAAITQRSRS